MDLISIFIRYPDQKDCIKHLEKVRFGTQPSCPHCGGSKVARKANGDRIGRWNCHDCKSSFTVLSKTIFQGTKIPLQKWFLAIDLLLNAKKSVSSHRLARDLELNQKTALRMNDKIRQAMTSEDELLRGIMDSLMEPPSEKRNFRKVVTEWMDFKIPPKILLQMRRIAFAMTLVLAFGLGQQFPFAGKKKQQYMVQKTVSEPFGFKNEVMDIKLYSTIESLPLILVKLERFNAASALLVPYGLPQTVEVRIAGKRGLRAPPPGSILPGSHSSMIDSRREDSG